MKKWSLVLAAALLAGCGTQGLVTQAAAPYNISLTSLGYEVDLTGLITVPAVTAVLTSTAGAHDISNITYTAILLNKDGKPATVGNSPIVPANGQLFSLGKGGYYCFPYGNGTTTVTTPEDACTVNDPGVQFVSTSRWADNTVANRAIVPVEWAAEQISARKNGDVTTAQWYAHFTFTGQVDGQTVTWQQNYQFTSPAKAGS